MLLKQWRLYRSLSSEETLVASYNLQSLGMTEVIQRDQCLTREPFTSIKTPDLAKFINTQSLFT